MKNGFYIKTAWNNILKNYRFYIPGILTGIGLQACFYIVLTLSTDERARDCKGGTYLPIFMFVGTFVISILSLILILYTNSFLMRQRKSEYGLYNVLGLEKKHIGRIMFYESLISASASVFAGLGFGMLFYKLCSLLICKLLKSDIILGFDYIRALTIIPSALFFFLIYFIAFLSNLWSLRRMKPAELLQSANVGEREPKVKWVMLVFGVITLGAGYTLALLAKSPSTVILFFMLAVILVIIGTYFLFTSGSIFVLKALKKNEKYYYQKKHMSLVSGLLFRMKQNAVGLASICILATGVLVMISSTVSLYSGMQETIDKRYTHDVYFRASWAESPESPFVDYSEDELRAVIELTAEKTGLEIENVAYEERDIFDFGVILSSGISYLSCDFKDPEAARERWQEFEEELSRVCTERLFNDNKMHSLYFDNRQSYTEELLGIYGILLFLGIILGLVCMFATVLIIYYKQISEGYEDCRRFQIMKKVGMSNHEIEQTVNTQTRFVFFLPLVAAGLHTLFAFPLINRILRVLLLPKTSLYLASTLITFSVFALLYVIIYSMTAKTYCKIVK